MVHIPVLQKEIIEILDPKENENFIDATAGEGGHTLLLAEKVKPRGKILAIDRDCEILEELKKRLKKEGLEKNVIPVCENYAHLEGIVKEKRFGKIKGILFDLGFSSWQIEKSKRGFSFQKNEPLDMRYSKELPLTVGEIVNVWPEKIIEKIIRIYGEERFSKKIAKKIVEERKKKEIKTTKDLVEIIRKAVPYSYQRGRIHFATRTFQALRITVNSEIDNLQRGLEGALRVVDKGGKIAVISFHSLEDRIVKRFFLEKAKEGILETITKKPIVPSTEEILLNPRSRSAKLRVAKKK